MHESVQQPDMLMHSAPWMNTSTSSGVAAATAAISSTVSSRASTTREKTHPLERRRARSVVHGHLRGGVQRQRRTYPPHQRRRAHVLHDRRVRARRRDGAHRIRKRIELRVEHERVERDMHAHIARVAVGTRRAGARPHRNWPRCGAR